MTKEEFVDKITSKEVPMNDDMRELLDFAASSIAKQIELEQQSLEEILQYMLRHQVKPPIRGEITKGKIRWRGLKMVFLAPNNTFMGLEQRGKLITPDWFNIKMKSDLEKSLIFGISSMHDRYEQDKQYCTGGIWNQIIDTSKAEPTNFMEEYKKAQKGE